MEGRNHRQAPFPGKALGRLPRRVEIVAFLDQLGAGGMGQVYLAEHTHMRRLVALKVLNPQAPETDKIVEGLSIDAFSQECINKTLAELQGEQDGVKHLL